MIFLPNVDTWCRTVGNTVVTTFLTLLRQLAPTDPVLVLGIVESESTKMDSKTLKELFGGSKKYQFELGRPRKVGQLYPLLLIPIHGGNEMFEIDGSMGLFFHHH